MNEHRLRGSHRRRAEQRITEIRHRLVMEEACGGAVRGSVADLSGFLELEEELLEEAAELERMLASGTGPEGRKQWVRGHLR